MLCRNGLFLGHSYFLSSGLLGARFQLSVIILFSDFVAFVSAVMFGFSIT